MSLPRLPFAQPAGLSLDLGFCNFLLEKLIKFDKLPPKRMKRWPIEFFEDEGGLPVRKWLDSNDVPEDMHGRVLARIDLLAQHGPTLDHPYTSQIEGKLREPRFQFGKTRYRVLYFFDERRVGVLLHGFTKNTAAVEVSDKEIGRSRMNAHNARLEAEKERAREKQTQKSKGRKKR